MIKPVYPCLWFDNNAKKAADLYCAVFSSTRITSESGLVVTIEFAGQKLMLLNGGPIFKINPSISFYVVLEDEKELESGWETLLEGGSVLMPLDKYNWSKRYGWLQDRFGVNWQLSLGRLEEFGQKITPVIMFTGEQNGRCEEAIKLYTSLFDDSEVKGIQRYSKGENTVDGAILHAQFALNKQRFMAMDSSLPHQRYQFHC